MGEKNCGTTFVPVRRNITTSQYKKGKGALLQPPLFKTSLCSEVSVFNVRHPDHRIYKGKPFVLRAFCPGPDIVLFVVRSPVLGVGGRTAALR